MKLTKVVAASAIIACLAATSSFAASADTQSRSTPNEWQQKFLNFKHTGKECTMGQKCKKGFATDKEACKDGKLCNIKDPVSKLQSQKEKLQALVKGGKLTQEKANEQIAKIDAKIKEVESFNKLTLEQKKAKLLADLKTSLDAKVKDGKLTQKKADEKIKNLTDKLNGWDGTGCLNFGMGKAFGLEGSGKGMKMKQPRGQKGFDKGGKANFQQKDPVAMMQSQKERIQALLKDGKITQEKVDKQIAAIDTKIKEIQDFNKLTLEQKKAKLISDFKAPLDTKVKDGKLTQQKADEMIKNFTEKLNKWDGNGYPKFQGREMFFGKKAVPEKK